MSGEAEPAPATARFPQGGECQCMAEGCGLFFSSETAFEKHWTRRGRKTGPAEHVHPSEVGMVERQRSRGPTWSLPGDGSDWHHHSRDTTRSAP